MNEEQLKIVSPPVYKKKTSEFKLVKTKGKDVAPFEKVKSLGIKINSAPELSSDEIEQEFEGEYWYNDATGRRRLNENVFAQAFCKIYMLNYANGSFYSIVGAVSEEKVKKMIWESIRNVIRTNVESEVNKLFGAVRLCATVANLIIDENIIPFANGDLNLKTNTFHENSYSTTAYRLGIDLPSLVDDAPNFNKWLDDLFYPEDIPAVQQYLGYCFIPSTKAQKTLLLVGEGGAGKSVMGVIVNAIFGDCAYNVTSTQEVLKNRFLFAELENKLVLYDDDLDSESFSETGLYKKLVTSTAPLMADKKYGKAFKFVPFARIICCTNDMITTSDDNAEAFYRRLLPIPIKPKSDSFVPDPKFYDKIKSEKNYITLWALKGLLTLIHSNDMILPESQRTKEFVKIKQMLGDPIPSFIADAFTFGADFQVPAIDIKNAYYSWCVNNTVKPTGYNKLIAHLTDRASKYNISYSNKLSSPDGSHVRGFKGMKLNLNHDSQGTNLKNKNVPDTQKMYPNRDKSVPFDDVDALLGI